MPDLETLAEADIAVVGGGLAGWVTAFELRRRGFDVVLLEQRFSAYGASGRNPGALWVQLRRAGAELDLARAGAAWYDRYLAEFGRVFDHHDDGGLLFFETEQQGALMAEYVAERRADGVPVELLDRAEAAKVGPLLPQTAIGAVHCPLDRQVDTAGAVRAIAAQGVAEGVRRFENTAVLGTVRRGDQVHGVRTVRGDVRAAGVVWATGAWAVNLCSEGLDLPVRTARLGHLRSQPVTTRSHVVLHGPRGVAGCGALVDLPGYDPALFAPPTVPGAAALEYDDSLAQHADGGLYVGSTRDGHGSLNPHISVSATHAMTGVLLERYAGAPAASGAAGGGPTGVTAGGGLGIVGLWAGLGCDTPDGLPLVGRADGVYLNTGHAWGVAGAPACGLLLAQLIAGEPASDAVVPVELLRPDRPGLTAPAADPDAG